MRHIEGFAFPENAAEAAAWVPQVRRVALHRQVLAVARTRIEGTWAAYIGPVPGENHDIEQAIVLDAGSKLLPIVAKTLFPKLACLPYVC